MKIEVSPEDAPLIREFIQTRLVELDREISRTESIDFRESLRQTGRALERLLGQLTSQSYAGEH